MGRVDHSSHHREENAFDANARLSSRAFFCLFRRDNMFVACDVMTNSALCKAQNTGENAE